ncbi:alkene reductase [Rhodopirellula sp. MGV]|uniref:alkene reductase n=1 Tax=Rhodopirellula sp. MGV TaxID=2023130 RepID=UPI000B9708BD|nr:alkene reductase [Rhodopirellula sp. MGV]OYP36419.1 alkene reductase [Rhodopirellula sp. MGV]PNY36846.1 alkene reductase [Rhodopirellula baltica]
MNNPNQSSELFRPLQIGSLELKNRVVMAPLTRARAGESRVPNEMMAEYYAQRSSAGLIISEATTISEQGIGWPDTPGIYTDEMQAGWKRIVDTVHQHGGRIFMQLWHTGRSSHSDFHHGELPVAPSAIAIDGDGVHTSNGKKPYETPRALETDELPGIVDDYRKATERAKAVGFDGVEIHSANGYLLDQFLQSKSNHRTDQYGGSVENRYRLLGEVVDAVTSAWSADRVGVRLAPNGAFNDMGSSDYQEQFLYTAQQLDAYGLAYLHVMDGKGFGFHNLGPAMTLKDFRKVFSGNLMGNVGYTKEAAEQAIASGDADFIAFGRPYISNPDLALRFENDWPLAKMADMSLWYSSGAHGYTDFPAYEATASV